MEITERVAVLETAFQELKSDVSEIRDGVHSLLEYHRLLNGRVTKVETARAVESALDEERSKRDHEPRIRKLEDAAMSADKVAQALHEQREQAERTRVQIRNWSLSLCGLLLGFAGFALANLH